ncbi:protein NLP8 isoform X2 [Arachis duranensis]|uniref:Protein NLP8 isoform X2 n=1 Tax=Arachis duranensis TaxID=130453 RepID=A0A6P5N6M6_ARADU|nr:protein NLP8 isoform X2 [Arachis duranensis]
MEDQFFSEGEGIGYWTPPGAQFDGPSMIDNGIKNLVSEEMLDNLPDLMNFDNLAGWGNIPSVTDHNLDNEISSLASMQYSPPDAFSLVEQDNDPYFMTKDCGNYNATETSLGFDEKAVLQQLETQLGLSEDANDMNNINGSLRELSAADMGNCLVPRPFAWSLDERMLRAMDLFKESVGDGILTQVWAPMKHGNDFILSTSEQPYLLDHMLAGYRDVSRQFTFSAEDKPGSFPGLPGRVFNSQIPEWTSNVGYYNKSEYLRVEHAINHEVRGSIAVPIIDTLAEPPCCAILELVTTKEKTDFDRELEIVSSALQLVNLRTTTPPRLMSQCLSNNKRAALAEIIDVLRAVCHAHRLPLALTWIPCYYSEGIGDEASRIRIKDGGRIPGEKTVLCIEESACYINDIVVGGFVHACVEHYLEEGQGAAGKALQSNRPFFCPDVKAYNISEYPLVHHARKYKLNAAVAVRLRSIHTNDDDYIIEFFLPVNMNGSEEQQLLLDNLSDTVQRMCQSLRIVSDAELHGIEGSQVQFSKEEGSHMAPDGDHDLVQPMSMTNNETEAAHNQAMEGSRKQIEKKRSPVKKNVSLSVLQQYFSCSLKDAAKSLGVCPTTLKRICRQHGIARWPSRKINKVNRSLKKIRTVLDSVQGVEGGLKFDPYKGGFMSVGSSNQEINAHKSSLFRKKCSVKYPDPASGSKDSKPIAMGDGGLRQEPFPVSILESFWCDIAYHSPNSLVADEMETYLNGADKLGEHYNPTTSSMTDSSNGSCSILRSSSSASGKFENRKHLKAKSPCVDSGSKIIVKAAYGEDLIRFKFDPAAGCLQLYEEVAARFKLQIGSFQLKYLDDEEEWVRMANDSDLEDCIEMLDDLDTRAVKLLVHDMPSGLSSLGSNG